MMAFQKKKLEAFYKDFSFHSSVSTLKSTRHEFLGLYSTPTQEAAFVWLILPELII